MSTRDSSVSHSKDSLERKMRSTDSGSANGTEGAYGGHDSLSDRDCEKQLPAPCTGSEKFVNVQPVNKEDSEDDREEDREEDRKDDREKMGGTPDGTSHPGNFLSGYDAPVKVEEETIWVSGFPIYVAKTHSGPLCSEYFKAFPQERKNTAIGQFAAMLQMPGLAGAVGLPDIHSGYAFPIGSAAAVDMCSSDAAVCPEGIGFDINCGVRSIRTSLLLGDLVDRAEELADALFRVIPTGVGGSKPNIISLKDLNGVLERGLEFLAEKQLVPTESLEYVESRGSLAGNSRAVPQQAKGRGLTQLASLGSGNHYLEIQIVKEIYDVGAADALGLKKDQVVVSIHTGSRGLGHVVCSTFSKSVNGRHFVALGSEEGTRYIALMNSAANYAWANRALIEEKTKAAIREVFAGAEFSLIYDVSHNIAKEETIGGRRYLVHRKGASRALPPGHPELPERYRGVGQPVPVGGSMGTCSFLLCGSEGSPRTYYSTCHGAGRVLSRSKARERISFEDLSRQLQERGIVLRCKSQAGAVEEAPDCYKDVCEVVDRSSKAGITRKVALLEPIIVIKG